MKGGFASMSPEAARSVKPKARPKIAPKPLTLAWEGGIYDPPKLLGMVPEGTDPKDIDGVDVHVGTMEDYLYAYMARRG